MGNRLYATLVSFEYGIITCINPTTNKIEGYVQRGVNKLSKQQVVAAIRAGMLPQNYRSYQEFPKNWSLYNEDKNILGSVKVTFSLADLNKKYAGR